MIQVCDWATVLPGSGDLETLKPVELFHWYLIIPQEVAKYLNHYLRHESAIGLDDSGDFFLYLNSIQQENLQKLLENLEARNRRTSVNFASHLNLRTNQDLFEILGIDKDESPIQVIRGQLVKQRLDLISRLFDFSPEMQERYRFRTVAWWLWEFFLEVEGLLRPIVNPLSGRRNLLDNWTESHRNWEAVIEGSNDIEKLFRPLAKDFRFFTYKQAEAHCDYIASTIVKTSRDSSLFDRECCKPYLDLHKSARSEIRVSNDFLIPDSNFSLRKRTEADPKRQIYYEMLQNKG
jgi:hypothetical protein